MTDIPYTNCYPSSLSLTSVMQQATSGPADIGGLSNYVSMTSLATQSPSSGGYVGFLPDELSEGKMVTWRTRKMKQMTVVLAFFILVALVMTGLFIWRSTFYQDNSSTLICNSKRCVTNPSGSQTPRPSVCIHRAKPRKFYRIPPPIRNVLKQIEAELNTTNSSAASIVYMDRVLWNHSHGLVDPQISSPHPPNRNSLFPVASFSKIITSLMLFKLYNDRKVESLEDPFIKYEPKFSIKDPYGSHNITLAELMSHMAGLPREAPCSPNTEDNICPYNNSIILARIREDSSLVLKPGERPYYSNLGPALLGRGLASWLNTTFETWMEEKLFKPLGMNDSVFQLTQESRKNMFAGYLTRRTEQYEWGWLNPAGGLFTSLADLQTLEIGLFKWFTSGGYLQEVFAHDFFAPAYALPDDKSLIGMAYWEMKLQDGYLIRQKRGSVYGYESDVFIVPELQLAFNLLQTTLGSTGNGALLFRKLVAAFHQVLHGNSSEERARQPPDPEPYVGVYLTNDVPSVTTMEITLHREKLYLKVNSLYTFPLNYIKERTFEIWDHRETECLDIFLIGVDLEKLYFEPINNSTHLSPGFTILGIHPSGWSYYNRTI